ncbi:MAG: rhomboid family intramembrane serine protease [Deltaproteobacteria bacterium]|nr:rhomboid family intramembrane serine protease [Deltaproteobacteria bacterium]
MADARPPGYDDEPSLGSRPGDSRWGTVGLLFANLALGLLMAWVGAPLLVPDDPAALIAFGAVDPPRIWAGEIWRLWSACFVHVGVVHLGLNLWVLWQVGRAYERLVGAARVVLVYLVSGVFGFALSIALLPGLTAGASGSIFGLTGALLAVAVLTRQQRLGRFLVSALLPFVLATFALGVLAPGLVNNVAHFGGLLMGFVLGYGLCAGERSFLGLDDAAERAAAEATVTRAERVLGTAALAGAVVVFAGVTLYALQPRLSPRFHAVMGLRAAHDASVARTEVERAEARRLARVHLDDAERLGGADAATLALASRVAALDGDEERARTRMGKAVRSWIASAGDRKRALDAATTELALLQPDVEMPYADGFTVRALCDAALDDEGRKAAGPEVKNSCAWLLLRAREPVVRDAARALPLAREAWDESGRERPEIVHTYAVALADNGAAAEGLALLELLSVSGRGAMLGPGLLERERARLGRLADEQARATVGRAATADGRPLATTDTQDDADAGAARAGEAGAIDADAGDAGTTVPSNAGVPVGAGGAADVHVDEQTR